MPIRENFPKEPINPYGATKLFFEQVLSAYSTAHGLRYVALRYFNAAGAHASGLAGEIHSPETHLIPLLIMYGNAAIFEARGIKVPKKRGAKKNGVYVAGKQSLDEEALLRIALDNQQDKLQGLILKVRELNKMRGTYVETSIPRTAFLLLQSYRHRHGQA